MTQVAEYELQTEAFTDNEGRLLCACGCGEYLKEGAKRSFIHGHKLRMDMENISDDPEPSDEAKHKGSIRVTAKIKKEMEDQLASWLGMLAGAWSMSDPYCAEPLMENAEEIAKRLVPLLSRNQAFVKYFRSSSSFKESMDLFILLFPIGKRIVQHHLLRTVGPSGQNGDNFMPLDEYTA